MLTKPDQANLSLASPASLVSDSLRGLLMDRSLRHEIQLKGNYYLSKPVDLEVVREEEYY